MYDVVITFNNGHQRYYEGERVAASNFEAETLSNFVSYGWLKAPGVAGNPIPTGVAVTLDIQDGQLGHDSEVL